MSAQKDFSKNSDVRKKFCSPPPKPPRRRHSDQSSISSCGPFLPNRKKYLNCSFSSDATKSLNVESSAECESLPASWIPDLADTPRKASFKTKKSVFVSPKTLKTSTPEKQTGSGAHMQFNGNHNLIPDLFTTNNWSPDENLNLHCSVSFKKSSNFCDIKSTSSDSCPTAFDISESKKVFHHRHHSDPLLLTANKSYQLGAKHQKHSSKLIVTDNNPAVHHFMSKDPFLLSEEIRLLKETNDKLWQHLCSKQAKLDCSQKSLPLAESNENSLSFADLVGDIYHAQKSKDLIFELRLNAALEERDSAIKELEEVLQSLTSAFEDNLTDDECPVTDKVLQDIIQKIEATENPAVLLQQQRILLSFLYQAKECKLQRLSHEIKVLQEEKEQALKQVKSLNDELKEIKCLTSSNPDLKQWESSLIGMLCQVITERDSAMLEVASLQEQIHTYNSSSGCYKEKLEIDSHNVVPTLEDIDSSACSFEMNSSGDFENSPNAIYGLRTKICTLAKQLDNEKKLRLLAQKKYERLGRIFVCTINKMNGLNVGIPV